MLLSRFFEWKPQGDFHYFNLAHILVIVIGVLSIVALCIIFRKTEHKNVKRVLSVVAVISLILDPIYWIWEYVVSGGVDIKGSLPLYYCSLFYMVLPFAIWCKNEKVKQTALAYLATFNLIAGLMGLIINTNLNVYPVWSFVGVRSLVYHLLMIFTSVFIWTTKYYTFNIHHTYSFLIPIIALFIPALIVDLNYGADYFYLNGGVGTPISIVSSKMPQAVYIFVLYFAILVLVNLIFYLPLIIKHFKNRKVYESDEGIE